MDKTLLVSDEIHLFGDVGDVMFGDGFLLSDVARALAEHGPGDVTARINSGGGIATEGMAIFSLLKSHPGKVNIVIDGIAASAASLIAMAGDTRAMRQGAVMMIHDPASITVGNVDAHQKKIGILDKLAESYAGVYGRASGKSSADARAVMKAETWLDASEAVKEGFATSVLDEAALEKAAFDYRIYARAPDGLPGRERLLIQAQPRISTFAAARMRMRQQQL